MPLLPGKKNVGKNIEELHGGETYRKTKKKKGKKKADKQAVAIAMSKAMEGRQEGGPVSAANSFVVGEDGPEVFTPKEDGVIIPNPKTKKKKSHHGPAEVPKPRKPKMAKTPKAPGTPKIKKIAKIKRPRKVY